MQGPLRIWVPQMATCYVRQFTQPHLLSLYSAYCPHFSLPSLPRIWWIPICGKPDIERLGEFANGDPQLWTLMQTAFSRPYEELVFWFVTQVEWHSWDDHSLGHWSDRLLLGLCLWDYHGRQNIWASSCSCYKLLCTKALKVRKMWKKWICRMIIHSHNTKQLCM